MNKRVTCLFGSCANLGGSVGNFIKSAAIGSAGIMKRIYFEKYWILFEQV